MNLLPSTRLKGVFFPRLLLKVLGVFFVVVPIVDVVLAYAVYGRNAHGYAAMILELVPTLLGGIGLLMPQLWANLFSSFVLCGFGLWLLIAHGLGWNHLMQASLSFTPLLLTLWMRAKYTNLQFRSADAN
jgi:hypothetical protein